MKAKIYSKNNDEIKPFYSSQIGYSCKDRRINIARMLQEAWK